MRMHDLTKNLKRVYHPPSTTTGATNSPTPASNTPSNLKVREMTPQWLLIESLQRGNGYTADALIDQPGLLESEKQLLKGMRAIWREELTPAEQTLTRVAAQLTGINKCWAHLSLAQLFIDQGNEESVDYHISRARRYAYEDRQDRQRLITYVDLIDARADVDRGAHENGLRTINNLLENCEDPYLYGLACYLIGCFGRFRSDMAEARSQNLSQAITIFQEQEPNRYLLALAQHELSYCDIDSREALKLAQLAAQALQELGRTRELRIVQTHVKELEEKVARGRLTNTAIGHDRVGQCLFISAPMRAIRHKLDAIAGAEGDPVLILGPRGSGKEMLAQSIHMLSPRSKGPMLAINCAALPDHLIESELFGYEKGAFTGANNQKRGLFELAENGTLFLDEMGELTPSAQTKLLRVLQTGQFRRLGSTVESFTNARIIAATNRDLADMAAQGTFRDDLVDRLSVWRLRIPPLSQRREEILPLAEEFLKRYGGEDNFRLDESAKQFLLQKDFPGNVRILENDIRRSIGNARAVGTNIIKADMICDDFETIVETAAPSRNQMGQTAPTIKGRPVSIEDIPNYDEAILKFERELLIRALAACQWNKKIAATALGMSERTFWRAIQRHRLHAPPEDNI